MEVRLKAVLERTLGIASGVVKEQAESIDREACWPEDGLRALLAAGLGGLVVPRKWGGCGHGLLALSQVCEILGKECASTALCFGMHCVGSAVIAAKADDGHRELLEQISSGGHLTTLALSEPGTGAHFYFPQTRLSKLSNEEFSVSGSKSFVTNGGRADSYVISTVAAESGAPPGQFSCVVVPKGSPGMRWGEPWAGIGMRGNSSRDVELAEVTIPASNLLGREGDQMWYVFNVIAPYFLQAMAGCYLGLASSALTEATIHLGSRRHAHSGARLGELPVLQHRLGSLWGMVERTRRLVYYAGEEGDRAGDRSLVALFSAKAEAAECAVTTVNEAMTLVGGMGYVDGSKLGRLLRDARAAHVMAPTTDILRCWAGRALLGLPLLMD